MHDDWGQAMEGKATSTGMPAENAVLLPSLLATVTVVTWYPMSRCGVAEITLFTRNNETPVSEIEVGKCS